MMCGTHAADQAQSSAADLPANKLPENALLHSMQEAAAEGSHGQNVVRSGQAGAMAAGSVVAAVGHEFAEELR